MNNITPASNQWDAGVVYIVNENLNNSCVFVENVQ